MLRLAKAFWDIALWRISPAQLPASLFLLGLVALIAALLEILSSFLPPISSDGILIRVALSVGLPVGFAWVVLALTRRTERFLQTAIALLGVGVLAGLLLYPLESLLQLIGSDRIAAVPLGILMLAGFVWYLLACANIWRAALDRGLGIGLAISVGYFLLSIVVEQQLLPDT
jgi:hypothetical protein